MSIQQEISKVISDLAKEKGESVCDYIDYIIQQSDESVKRNESLCTHISKTTNPDSKGPKIYCDIVRTSLEVGFHSVKHKRVDYSTAAMYGTVPSFLLKSVGDENMWFYMINKSGDFAASLEAIGIQTNKILHLLSNISKITKNSYNLATMPMNITDNKQVFFAQDYLLVILSSIPFIQEMKMSLRSGSNGIFYNLPQRIFGGTRPQNISIRSSHVRDFPILKSIPWDRTPGFSFTSSNDMLRHLEKDRDAREIITEFIIEANDIISKYGDTTPARKKYIPLINNVIDYLISKTKEKMQQFNSQQIPPDIPRWQKDVLSGKHLSSEDADLAADDMTLWLLDKLDKVGDAEYHVFHSRIKRKLRGFRI